MGDKKNHGNEMLEFILCFSFKYHNSTETEAMKMSKGYKLSLEFYDIHIYKMFVLKIRGRVRVHVPYKGEIFLRPP